MAGPLPTPAMGHSFRDVILNPFYLDEKLITNANANRFGAPSSTTPTTFGPLDTTFGLLDPNPIEASEQLKLGLPSISRANPENYFIFVPGPTRAAVTAGTVTTVKVSLLFCVGSQMFRAGLRTFFEERTDAVLITIPGWEKPGTVNGIGITDAMIVKLFNLAGIKATPEIHVVAGYSTGYRGLIGSINDGVITLSKIKSMIFYDCLYIADDYFPGGNKTKKVQSKLDAVRTRGAVDKVLAATNNQAEIVIYDVTQGGTTHYQPRPDLPSGGLAIAGHTLVDLKTPKPGALAPAVVLGALTAARLLDEGATDGFFPRSKIPTSIGKLIPLPKRGGLSTGVLPNGGPARSIIKSQQLLKNWGASNSAAIAAMQGKDLLLARSLVFTDQLMGWPPPTFAETEFAMLHDQFMPEFAHEFLTPP